MGQRSENRQHSTRDVGIIVSMVTIRVQGQLEDRLKRAASSAGAQPEDVAEQVLDQHLPRPNQATLDLLAEWEREHATTDEAELKKRAEEVEEFMQGLAQARIDSEGPNARKLWP